MKNELPKLYQLMIAKKLEVGTVLQMLESNQNGWRLLMNTHLQIIHLLHHLLDELHFKEIGCWDFMTFIFFPPVCQKPGLVCKEG